MRSRRTVRSPARRASHRGSRRRARRAGSTSRRRSRPANVTKPATPSRKPTTRFVPAARLTSMPTARTSVGIRSVPRMTPTAPPRAPMPSPPATAGQSRSRSRVRACTGRSARSMPLQTSTAAIAASSSRSETSPAASAPRTAPATDGGAIQATIRQSTRRSRAWRIAPAPADAAEIAMFVPAAASGLPVNATIRGSRSVPSTNPSIEPTYPATNEPASASASSQASTTARRVRSRRWRRGRG